MFAKQGMRPEEMAGELRKHGSSKWSNTAKQQELAKTWTDLSEDKIEPQEIWYGYPVRPGYFDTFGVSVIEGGLSFTINSSAATNVEILLFHYDADEPFAIIPYPDSYKIGDVYSMIIFGLDIEDLEYCFRLDGPYQPEKGLIFDKSKTVVDPYARRVIVRSENPEGKYPYRARVQIDAFDWSSSVSPHIPEDEMIIYEAHVKGFTKNSNSGVENPGTFAGLIQKIPYLKSLGVNVIELMPVFEFDPKADSRIYAGQELVDYWGYNPVAFFALTSNYNSEDYGIIEGHEFKSLVKTLHDNGMQVILDVVFNHTVEGNEFGPYISFKGIDNQIYYMLTPEGYYYNFSGCGNTFNCNHPVARQMILECLRYWVRHYRVDGFRFDLASILGRDESGAPLSNPPLIESLAYDPILRNVKLIAEAWDAGGLYQVGSFPSYTRWAEWNGRYRDILRQFLKGDAGKSFEAVQAITGSKEMYPIEQRGKYASVNFITCHDGFTLRDLYTYNEKHNEANGWNNTDGENYNNSWNCGVEGETGDVEINALRKKMMLNACVTLLSSVGIPMISAGDEFANTQYGNNNPYCQDNDISWINWDKLRDNEDIFNFWRKMISFRKEHPILRGSSEAAHCGLPDSSYHGHQAWNLDTSFNSHYVGVMYAGRNNANTEDEVIYLAINAHWERAEVYLPKLPHNEFWLQIVNTSLPMSENFVEDISEAKILDSFLIMEPRSVVLLLATPLENEEAASNARAEMAELFVKNQKAKSELYLYNLIGPIKTGSKIPWGVPLKE